MIRQYASFARKIFLSNIGRLDRPFKLTFVTTKECHSKCINCDIWKVKPQNELTLEEITQLAKNSPFLSWVDFTGGEPSDRKDLVDVIKAFCTYCPDLLCVHFPTNGLKTRRITKVVEELLHMRAPNLTITVSIDGPPSVNDTLRGIPGDFERASDTYLALEQLGVSVYVGMTLYKDNMHLLDETVESLKKKIPRFGYDKLHVNIPHVSGHYYGNDQGGPKMNESMADVVGQFVKKRRIPRTPVEIVERLYHRRVKEYLTTKKCPQDCAALMSSCFLSETGMVYPCNIWNEPLGNVRDHEYSLLPILASSRSKDLREQLLQKNCPNCWTPCEAYQTILGNII